MNFLNVVLSKLFAMAMALECIQREMEMVMEVEVQGVRVVRVGVGGVAWLLSWVS